MHEHIGRFVLEVRPVRAVAGSIYCLDEIHQIPFRNDELAGNRGGVFVRPSGRLQVECGVVLVLGDMPVAQAQGTDPGCIRRVRRHPSPG